MLPAQPQFPFDDQTRIISDTHYFQIFSHRPNVPPKPGVFDLHGHIHDSVIPELGARHVNLCMEVRDYRPWGLGEI